MTFRPLLYLVITAVMTAIGTSGALAEPKGIEEKVLDGIPLLSKVSDGYETVEDVTDRLASMPLHSIEGVWRFAAEGTLMAIEREDDIEISPEEAGTVRYRMVVVRAADLSLRPGTAMGYLAPTAKRGVYDARVYTGRSDSGVTLHSPKTFTITLSDSDSRITISRYGSSIHFNWWRLLPYMYRRVITKSEKKPGEINGCMRVYPAPAVPTEPRYL